MNYNKPALSIDQQINLLASRGLNFPDIQKARKIDDSFRGINLYRVKRSVLFILKHIPLMDIGKSREMIRKIKRIF